MTAQQLFTDIVKGRNFFTPVLVSYFKIDNGAIELSKSNSFYTHISEGKNIYGVTIVQYNRYLPNKSKVFGSSKDAMDYIKEFKPTVKQQYIRVDSYGTRDLVSTKL